MKKKFIEFLMQTSSGTLGTIIGIILTFGTTYFQQEREQKQMERTAALMVISNLDGFCQMMEDKVKEEKATDSLNVLVWTHYNK